jgi:hypothetical protein
LACVGKEPNRVGYYLTQNTLHLKENTYAHVRLTVKPELGVNNLN